jgi:hypothetical protein
LAQILANFQLTDSLIQTSLILSTTDGTGWPRMRTFHTKNNFTSENAKTTKITKTQLAAKKSKNTRAGFTQINRTSAQHMLKVL